METFKNGDFHGDIQKWITFQNSLDTERKLNAHKTFRRRPGPFLNAFMYVQVAPYVLEEFDNITFN